MPFKKGLSGNPRGRWKKGESGNPGGRPKGLSRLLKERYGEAGEKLVLAMDELAFAKEGNPSNRYRMLADLLDRHSGKPTQAYEQAGPEGQPLVTRVIHEYHPAPSKQGPDPARRD